MSLEDCCASFSITIFNKFYLTVIPRARVEYEIKVTNEADTPNSTSASRIIVLLKQARNIARLYWFNYGRTTRRRLNDRYFLSVVHGR